MAEEREEYLEADKEIPGQKFVCLSFLSPENVLANKDLFFFNAFLKDYEIQFKIKATESFLMNEVKRVTDAFSKGEDLLEEVVSKINDKTVTFEDVSGATDLFKKTRASLALDVNDALEKFVKSNMNDIKDTTIQEDYETYLFKNRKKLDDDFFAKNNFRTTVRGLKIRGCYDTFDEASHRAKSLQKLDPSFNVFVGQMGFWLPWDPAASDISKQEYAEDQLNTLMKSYRDNESKKDEFFESQKRERLQGAKVRDSSNTVIGPTNTDDNSAVKGMFDDGDLAIARKKASAAGNTLD
jgi:Family of unknown function (DUF5832)